MSDLSNLLGDVYGDHSDPDAAPVRREPAAGERAPEWAADAQLDRAFDGWVPGEPPTGRSDDLTSALAAALTPAPAPEAVPMPTVAQAPAAPAPASWTSAAPAAAVAAPVMVTAPASSSFWSFGDDDIFPSSKGGKKAKKR
jgi:hypothetical protein